MHEGERIKKEEEPLILGRERGGGMVTEGQGHAGGSRAF